MINHRNRIAVGTLAQKGLLDAEALDKAAELLQQLASREIETVRVLFADQHGVLRGKTIVVSALESLFLEGLGAPSTLMLKDTAHKTVFPIWSEEPVLQA